MLWPHTRTPVSTARGWRTPTTRLEGGQSGEGERPTQTPHATAEGAPHGDTLSQGPARAHAVRQGQGLHAHFNRTRDTQVAEPRPPATGDGRPAEGARLTSDTPHNDGGPPPPGTAPHHRHGTQPPQDMQAKGTVLGPHTRTTVPTARGWRTPTARQEGGQWVEGGCPTPDAPHQGGRHPPEEALPPPQKRNAGPQGHTLLGRCRAPTPAPTAPGTHGSRNPGCPPQRTSGRGRDSA